MPTTKGCIIMTCTIIVQVQTFLGVKFLTVVLVGLYVGRCREQTTKWVVVVGFLYRSAVVYYYTIVTLMVFQVVIIGAVDQIYLTLVVQQAFGRPVFIDYVAAVVSRSGCTINYMRCSQLRAIGTIHVADGVTITERNYLWQR